MNRRVLGERVLNGYAKPRALGHPDLGSWNPPLVGPGQRLGELRGESDWAEGRPEAELGGVRRMGQDGPETLEDGTGSDACAGAHGDLAFF